MSVTLFCSIFSFPFKPVYVVSCFNTIVADQSDPTLDSASANFLVEKHPLTSSNLTAEFSLGIVGTFVQHYIHFYFACQRRSRQGEVWINQVSHSQILFCQTCFFSISLAIWYPPCSAFLIYFLSLLLFM